MAICGSRLLAFGLIMVGCSSSPPPAETPKPVPLVSAAAVEPAASAVPPTPVVVDPMVLEDLGKTLFDKKGCAACHSLDGSARIGPSLFKSFGTKVTLSDGSVVEVDDAYIRESVMVPLAKTRPGYPPTHPSYEGALTDRELSALIAYLKSLK